MPRLSISLRAALILAIALALGGYAWVARQFPEQADIGKALVGGPFTLTDQDGRLVTERDFAGHFMLIFFGYTFCPDICPTELQVMMAAVDELGPEGNRIQPIFISVDPARDTPDVLKAYVGNFSPRLLGLTGTPEQIAAVAKAYRVYFSKVEGTQSNADYLMDHSSIIYLMGPDGQFVKHMTYTTDAAKLAGEIKGGLTSFR